LTKIKHSNIVEVEKEERRDKYRREELEGFQGRFSSRSFFSSLESKILESESGGA